MTSSSFFLIEIELWKINDSEPAPKFNIVERPNTWAKAMKKDSSTFRNRKLEISILGKVQQRSSKTLCLL